MSMPILSAAGGTPVSHRPRRRLGRAVAALLLATLPALAVATAVAAPAAAQPSFTEEERAAAIVRPGVVYIETEWEGWVRDKRDGLLWDSDSVYFVNRCTGFVTSEDGYIVTAGHCVDPGMEGAAPLFYETIAQRLVDAGVIEPEQYADAVTVISENSEIEGLAAGDPVIRNVYVQRGVAVSGLTTGEAFPARVIDVSAVSNGDVAVLKVDESDLPAVEMAPEGDLSVGTSILAVGYPGSADDISDSTLEPSNTEGKISNLRTEAGVPFYETNAAMTGGMSGGPVVNMDGQVIGLVSHGPAGESQGFNFIAASSLITEMLSRNGVTYALSDLDVQYREALEHYYAGRYGDAIETFDAVLARVPAHQQAQELRQLAVERQATEGDAADDDSGLSGSVIAIAAAGLGLIVVAGVLVTVLLVMRGRKRRTAPAVGYGAAGGNGASAPMGGWVTPPPGPAPSAAAAPPAPPPLAPPAAAAPPTPLAPPAPPAPPANAQPAPAGGYHATATAPMQDPVPVAPAPAASETGQCRTCGAAIAPNGRFCTNCGTPVT
jgi:S1-C subfamily serine protease